MSDDSKDTDEVAKASEPAAKASEPAAKGSPGQAKASEPAAKASGGDANASEPRSAVLREPELPGAGTPQGEALRRGLALYRVGNYREMRVVLEPLTTAKDPAVADAASALLKRIAVDRVQIGFLVGCLLAIVAIASHYLGH